MTKFQKKARKANTNQSTLEVTIPSNVREMENIEHGDKVTLKIIEVDKKVETDE